MSLASHPAAVGSVIGDNLPPSLVEILGENHAGLLAEMEVLAARANAAPKKITDDTSAETVRLLNRDANAFNKRVDSIRKEEKEPHLQAGRDVDDFFRPMLERSDKVKAFFQSVADEKARGDAAEERRRRDEEARKLREEEARQREIADRAAAAARPTQAAKAETKADDVAARAERLEVTPVVLDSAKTEWAFRIIDIDKIDLNSLRAFIAPEVIDKALRQHLRINKGSRPLVGVEFFEDVKAKLR